MHSAFRVFPAKTKLVKLEDMKEGYPLDRYIVYLSGQLALNVKGKEMFFAKREDAPKWFGSTNFVQLNDDDSMSDRIFELEFSDHYNLKHRPADDFGRMFFVEWSKEDWYLFDNFMLNCVQFFLQSGGRILEYEKGNIKQKRFLAKIREKFKYKYRDLDMNILINHLYGIKVNETCLIKDLYSSLLESETSYKDASFSQRSFTECIQIFAEYRGYIVVKPHTTKIELKLESELTEELGERLNQFVNMLKPNTYYLREVKSLFSNSYPAEVSMSDFERVIKDRALLDQKHPETNKNTLTFVDNTYSMLRVS